MSQGDNVPAVSLPYEEQISLASYKQEGYNYTNEELQGLARKIRTHPELLENAIHYRASNRKINMIGAGMLALAAFFIIFVVIPSASQPLHDRGSNDTTVAELRDMCYARENTPFASAEYFMGSLVVLFVVWLLSVFMDDFSFINRGSMRFRDELLHMAFVYYFPFPMFLWTSSLLFLLPTDFCTTIAGYLSNSWFSNAFASCFQDLVMFLNKFPVVNYFLVGHRVLAFAAFSLILFLMWKSYSIALTLALRNLLGSALFMSVLAITAADGLSFLNLCGPGQLLLLEVLFAKIALNLYNPLPTTNGELVKEDEEEEIESTSGEDSE